MENLRFIKTTDQTDIDHFRNGYFDHLPFSQEYYLEILINASSFYEISVTGRPAGYFILSPNNILLEYYVLPAWVSRMDELFGIILKEFHIEKALCKTFDTDFLFCCLAFQKKSSTAGYLFREYNRTTFISTPPELTVRRAELADETQIIAVNEEVFDNPEEVGQYIRAQQIFLFEKEGNLVGFGIYSPVIRGRKDYDIGMLITPPYRKQGYGVEIIRYLVNFCRQNGWNPYAGCAAENIGSRKCLEKAGFITRHRLIKFLF